MFHTLVVAPLPDLALVGVLLIVRIALGAFFAISGFHKAFFPERRAVLCQTFHYDGFPSWAIPKLLVLVPAVELVGGLFVMLGFGYRFALAALLGVCFVACIVDGLKRIPAMNPMNRADWLDDVLYLPETWLLLSGLVLFVFGPGAVSLDHLLWGV